MRIGSWLYGILICAYLFSSCIGDYILDDVITETVRVINPIDSITVGESHQFEGIFFNNVGVNTSTTKTWTSSNTNICSIDDTGLATAIAPGNTTIDLVALGSGGSEVSTSIDIVITEEPIVIVMNTERTGSLVTTSSYELTGDFTLTNLSGTLVLSLDDNYRASSSLPGLFIYLSNNPNSTSDAFEIGEVTTFSGAHNYTLPPNIGLNDFSHVLYFCKPFGVKVGDGAFTN